MSVVLWLLVLAAFFQPSAARRLGAFLFVALAVCHDVFFRSLDGFEYYFSAAMFDLFAIVGLSAIRPVTKMAIRLQIICGVSIAYNLGGFILWFLYLPPFAYNTCYLFLYAVAAYVLLLRGHANVGGGAVLSGGAGFHKLVGAGRVIHSKNEGAL